MYKTEQYRVDMYVLRGQVKKTRSILYSQVSLFIYVGFSVVVYGMGWLICNRTIINSQNINAFCNDYLTRSIFFIFG